MRGGEADVALAGGSEALIVPGVMMAWQAMQTLAAFEPGQAATACRPFARDRSGFSLYEGAAFLVLEPAARARARGARVYALLSGWGASCDATHLTKPDSGGQQRALRQALAQARLAPADVGYCNAHGTATKVGDVVEIDTLRVSSTKSMHGHLLGADGALEAAITVLALHHRALPPNVHCSEPDPGCPLNLVLDGDERAPNLQGRSATRSPSAARIRPCCSRARDAGVSPARRRRRGCRSRLNAWTRR